MLRFCLPVVSFFLFLLASPILGRNPHVIPLPSSADLRPSSVAWDPSGQHFLVGSRHRPLISSVSDAGVVQTLISSDAASATSSVASISVDAYHRRLIAAFSSPASISAYDLRSPVPHRLIFSSPLPEPFASVSGAAVDPTTGTAFIATSSGQIFALDLDGKVSNLAQVSSEIGGAAHVNKGYLLVVDKQRGGILKVDAEDGVTKRVLTSAAAAAAETVAIRSDGTAVVAGGSVARWVKSEDGWAEAAAYDEFKVGDSERILGVVVREGKRAYVLVAGEDEGEGQNVKSAARIEEVEWGREGEGEMVWTMALVGLGLAYFMYWRLQMGKLVTSINKKRA